MTAHFLFSFLYSLSPFPPSCLSVRRTAPTKSQSLVHLQKVQSQTGLLRIVSSVWAHACVYMYMFYALTRSTSKLLLLFFKNFSLLLFFFITAFKVGLQNSINELHSCVCVYTLNYVSSFYTTQVEYCIMKSIFASFFYFLQQITK